MSRNLQIRRLEFWSLTKMVRRAVSYVIYPRNTTGVKKKLKAQVKEKIILGSSFQNIEKSCQNLTTKNSGRLAMRRALVWALKPRSMV